ncbi:MAG TPA: ATP-binding protein [Burkholderiales bacterium]
MPAWLAVVVYLPAYLLMDWASHIEPQALLGIAPWDPPAGLSFALLLTYGLGMAPAVAIADIGGELLMRALPAPPSFTILAALVMTAGYCGAAAILRNVIQIDPRLRSFPDLASLTGAVFVSALVVAFGFVGVYTLLGIDVSEDVFRTVLHFWIGDVSGILAVTPFVLVYGTRLRHGVQTWVPTPAMVAEAAALVLAIWIVFGLEITDDFRFFYLLFLPVIWIAMRHGIEGATVAVLGVQLGLIVGVGYRGRAAGTVLELQLLMLILAMTGLFLGMVVTERRGALGALNDRESELNRMLRLAGAGEMASALAHELNQPLTAITAYLSACRTMLQSPGGREQQIADTMDKAVHEAGRAAEVVRRLREYFGTGVVRLEPCAAGELVRAAAEPLRSRLDRAGITLDLDCPADLPKVLADRLQLEIVFHNLLGNAVDAVARAAPAKRQIQVAAAAEHNMLRIKVADSGPGVTPEIQERLFQPFATSKPQGMGLGLAISRSIVEAHYGKLWYERSPAGGAVFNLMLPIHAPPGSTRP